MSAEQKNSLIVHGDLQHVTVLAEIEIFGHRFKRREPMDFIIASRFDSKICAYLEVGGKCYLHEKEPIVSPLHGYQSDGYVLDLDFQGDGELPHGIYPLRVAE